MVAPIHSSVNHVLGLFYTACLGSMLGLTAHNGTSELSYVLSIGLLEVFAAVPNLLFGGFLYCGVVLHSALHSREPFEWIGFLNFEPMTWIMLTSLALSVVCLMRLGTTRNRRYLLLCYGFVAVFFFSHAIVVSEIYDGIDACKECHF